MTKFKNLMERASIEIVLEGEDNLDEMINIMRENGYKFNQTYIKECFGYKYLTAQFYKIIE